MREEAAMATCRGPMLDADNQDRELHTPMTDIDGFDLIAPEAYGERGARH